jgi:hypothetical protein
MRQRFRLYRRKKGGRYYIHDDVTGKQESLGTSDRATAVRLFHSESEATKQPAVNLQIARAYLAASDPQIATRNWQFVVDEIVKLKKTKPSTAGAPQSRTRHSMRSGICRFWKPDRNISCVCSKLEKFRPTFICGASITSPSI